MKTNSISLRFSPSIQNLLRLEGVLEFAVALALYVHLGGNGWVFAALLLTPDITMLGYLRDPRFGAFTYNLAHTTTFPLALGIVAFFFGTSSLVLLALIWLAHIGMDRAIGYGLKGPSSFKSTHLNNLEPKQT
jgi:Domain of unknown function (DUF4260)